MLVSHLWDPDGVGPLPEQLVVGGRISMAGDARVVNLAMYDEASRSWTSLGAGLDPFPGALAVEALATMPNGDLAVGGQFSSAGGVPVQNVATFDGTSWHALGAGVNGAVRALAVMPGGDLVAAGSFSSSAGVGTANVARWDGSSWSPLGSGLTWLGGNVDVRALATMPNGDLVAGGWFTEAGGSNAVGIARWNGSYWAPIGGGLNSAADAIQIMANGDMVVGGYFGTAGGVAAKGIARWDGSSWSPLGSGVGVGAVLGHVLDLVEMPNGDLIATGPFESAGGVSASNIARWDGSSWSSLGSGVGSSSGTGSGFDSGVAVSLLPSGELFVGGRFEVAGGTVTKNVAVWDGTAWRRLNDGVSDSVYALLPLPDGGLVAGGDFRVIGGNEAAHVARWDGASWSNLGSGFDGRVTALSQFPNGDLVAGGYFLRSGTQLVRGLARWNGSTWAPASPTFIGGSVLGFARRSNGQLLAVGSGQRAVRYWNGSAWLPLGGVVIGAFEPTYRAVVEMPNGDIVVGGDFTSVAGVSANFVARYDGAAWHAMGAGMSGLFARVDSLALAPDGRLLAGGAFTFADGIRCNGVAVWDGSAWSPLGNGFPTSAQTQVYKVVALPNGDVLAAGLLGLPGAQVRGVARWDGSGWSVIGRSEGNVEALALAGDGTLWAGGGFLSYDSVYTPFYARLEPRCPATVVDLGGGCSGTVGPVELTVTERPWLGGAMRAHASGLANSSIAAAVYGFSATTQSLAALFSQALPGCDLLVSPDHVDFALAAAGSVDVGLLVPNSSPLIGLSLFEQVISLELAPSSGALVAVSSSNALEMTVGAF